MCQSGSAGRHCRYRSDDVQLRPNVQNPERTKTVTSFYFHPAIDQAAAKVSLMRIFPESIISVDVIIKADVIRRTVR